MVSCQLTPSKRVTVHVVSRHASDALAPGGAVQDWENGFQVNTICWPSSPRTVAVEWLVAIVTVRSRIELHPGPKEPPVESSGL